MQKELILIFVHVSSASPLKAEEMSGVVVEALRSHPVTPLGSTDTSLGEEGEEEEDSEGTVTDSIVMRVSKYLTHCIWSTT